MKYKVSIEVKKTGYMEIEADNEEDALDKADDAVIWGGEEYYFTTDVIWEDNDYSRYDAKLIQEVKK